MELGRNVAVARNLIALVLAIGLCVALNVIVAAILYDAIKNPNEAGISENATQILTGWGGGIVGILGAVFGYEAGTRTDPPPNRAPVGGVDARPDVDGGSA